MRDLTIAFDLDGTLVDTAPDLVAATNHALADLGLAPVRDGALRPYISLGARRMIVEGLRGAGQTLGEPELDRLHILFLTHYEANIATSSRPFEGVVDVLHDLKHAGARLAVCTNKREGLSRLLLDALNLTPLFDAVAGRDTFPVCKPHPDHLRGAVRLAGGDERRTIMVGDTGVDIETARAALLPSIAVSFGYSETPVEGLGASHCISRFRELPDAIRTLSAARFMTDPS
ncbi:MAG: HAD-IA family hydrolase [Hyphomicrobium sp.]